MRFESDLLSWIVDTWQYRGNMEAFVLFMYRDVFTSAALDHDSVLSPGATIHDADQTFKYVTVTDSFFVQNAQYIFSTKNPYASIPYVIKHRGVHFIVICYIIVMMMYLFIFTAVNIK